MDQETKTTITTTATNITNSAHTTAESLTAQTSTSMYVNLSEAFVKQQQTIEHLQQQIKDLKNFILEKGLNLKNVPKTAENDLQSGYCTDEDELEKEFSEVNKKSSKRKRVPTKSPNRMAKQVDIRTETKSTKAPLPPPINIYNVIDFNSFRKELLAQVKGVIKCNAISNNVIKITSRTEEEYRKVKHFLIQSNENLRKDSNNINQPPLEYHTYQLKSERLYRIVIRGLQTSMNATDIAAEIQSLGHEVTNVLNVQKTRNINGEKKIYKFPLFYVDIKQNENNKLAFNITELLNCKVKVEPPNKTNSIPQCTNCQQLGHTKSFCSRKAKCVKCAGNHLTTSCTKTRHSVATCALCNEKGHPANYKGCPVYQNKLKSQQTKISVAQRVKEKKDKPDNQALPSTSGLSYAQVTNKSTEKPTTVKKLPLSCNEPTITDVMKLLSSIQADMKKSISQLTNRVDRLENKSPPKKKVKSTQHE